MLPPLSLAQYHALLRSADGRASDAPLPCPSEGQIGAFVRYFQTQHSWYKHLPLTPPGAEFFVFLDPGAGMLIHRDAAGRATLRNVDAGDQLFHYSMLPTAQYKERFGLLNARNEQAPGFELHAGDGTSDAYVSGPGILVDGVLRALPQEIREAGRVELTALIHPNASASWLWEESLGTHAGDEMPIDETRLYSLRWPDETGGRRTLDAIARALRLGYEERREALRAACQPEQLRQAAILRQACKAAVQRVCEG